MTIYVSVEYEMVTYAPPIARKFIGQPFDNLVKWMAKQDGFILRGPFKPKPV